jgi:hypothetical protein
MDFVNDVDLVFTLRRREVDLVAQIADVVNGCVRCRVDFDEIQETILVDGFAVFTFVIRSFCEIGICTIDGLCQKTGERGLTCSTRTSEQIGVCNAIRGDGILEGGEDMILPYDFVPFFRSILSIECL